ncbi:VOC family protein [Paraburkholderia sp. RL18-085-BIA-A]|uniref:VOC family protein n=1 Tax=Paraburkholderia sp. RL18-085-BIA-A TaxID=3031633 RepID=UPI0038B9A838
MIRSISHATYRHRDLAAVRTFFEDFGLVLAHETPDRIFFRGCNDAPYLYIAERAEDSAFVGVAFEVDSEESLRVLSARLGAPVEDLEYPGGGKRVTTTDPDGRRIELVHGVARVAPIAASRPAVAWNSGGERRRLGRFPIFNVGPAEIIGLKHVVMSSPNPPAIIEWFVEKLGAFPSDLIGETKENVIGGVMRFPRGAEYVDHHNIAVFRGPTNGAHHVCFETIDLDAIGMGRRHLVSKGYKASWGLVRHSLGGAISDYWYDPSGFRVEHVTDGDFLNDTYPTRLNPHNQESLEQWGTMVMPEDFLRS